MVVADSLFREILHIAIMSVDVAAELAAPSPNESQTFQYNKQYVRVDLNRIMNDIVDAGRNSCAAQFCRDANDQSCIIDGVPYGPVPTSKATWNFVNTRPFVINEVFSDVETDSGFPHYVRKEVVESRFRVGYKWVSAAGAIWRPYPEVEQEQRSHLWGAVDDAIHGRQAVRREATVTQADGRPKSA
jgi:hypothetical protein